MRWFLLVIHNPKLSLKELYRHILVAAGGVAAYEGNCFVLAAQAETTYMVLSRICVCVCLPFLSIYVP